MRFIMISTILFKLSVCSAFHIPSLELFNNYTIGATIFVYPGTYKLQKFNLPKSPLTSLIDVGNSPTINFYKLFFPSENRFSAKTIPK